MARWPRGFGYVLPKNAIPDIEHLVERVADLPRVLDASTKLKPGLQVADIFENLSAQVDVPSRDLRRIFNSLENLRVFCEELGSPDQALARLLQIVKSSVNDKNSDLVAKLAASEVALSSALGLYTQDNPIVLTFKAQRLTYNRERLFNEVELISDARPVFDSKGESIVEFVITHSLVITSVVNSEYRREHYSLDNADILNIRAACDRAILKARILKEALSEKWPAEVLRDDADS